MEKLEIKRTFNGGIPNYEYSGFTNLKVEQIPNSAENRICVISLQEKYTSGENNYLQLILYRKEVELIINKLQEIINADNYMFSEKDIEYLKTLR